MNNKNIPTSLEYFEDNIARKGYNDAHKYLLQQIGLLLGLGWKYDDVKKLKILKDARDSLAKKFPTQHYPFLIKLIDFVYTRDLAHHPFGSWIELNPHYLLAYNDFAADLIKQNSFNINQIKLAGLLFAIGNWKTATINEILATLDELRNPNKRADGDTLKNKKLLLDFFDRYKDSEIIRIMKPSEIYFNADLESETFHKYCGLLKIKTHIQRTNKDEYRTTLWIVKPRQLLFDAGQLKEVYKNKYAELVKTTKPADMTFLESRTNERSFIKIKENFERRYLNANKRHFSNRPLPGFPFYRMDNFSESKILYIPQKLMNYRLIFAAIFGMGTDQYIRENFRLKAQTLKHIGSTITELKAKLLDANLNHKYYPITSPQEPNKIGKHFEQINKTMRVIGFLNSNGLGIDPSKISDLSKLLEDYKTQYRDSEIPLKIKAWIDELDRIIKFVSIKDNRTRLTGYFTPHASRTHRMTCHRFNLQMMSKEVKGEIYSVNKGWSILSADVAGQDIAVAANLAKRIYNDPFFMNVGNKNQILQLRQAIDGTLKKLSQAGESSARPIDYITDKIISEDIEQLSGLSRNEIRKNLKSIVYATFYGGSVNTLIKETKKELAISIKDLEIDAKTILENDYKMPKNFDAKTTESKIKKLQNLYNEINSDVWINPEEKYLEPDDDYEDVDELKITFGAINLLGNHELQPIQNSVLPTKMDKKINPKLNSDFSYTIHSGFGLDLMDRVTIRPLKRIALRNIFESIQGLLSKEYSVQKNIERWKLLNKVFLKYMVDEYPGIMDSFVFYEKYLESEENKLTYPTLLNWQTNIEGEDNYTVKSSKTKSKSYPIQASGAEFIREWLLALTLVDGYQNSFRIINVVHDQIMVEVMEEHRYFIAKELIKAAKNAARIVGLEFETIHIPEVEVIC